MAKLSIVLNSTQLSGQLKQIKDLEIEIDQEVVDLSYALSFSNCKITFFDKTMLSNLNIYTDQGLRFEDCQISANINVCGKDGAAGFKTLEKKGPNVFFDNCTWQNYLIEDRHIGNFVHKNRIQISGYINHFRSKPHSSSKNIDITVSQCRFDKIEIIGSYGIFQLIEYTGNELIIKNMNTKSIWIRENLNSFIKFIDIDNESTENICKSFISRSTLSPYDLDVVKNLMDVFSRKKEGYKFLQMNQVYCQSAITSSFAGFIVLAFFKNFYSLKPWVLLIILTVLIFTFIYYPFKLEPLNSFLASLYSISGNPIFDKNEPILSIFQSIEAFLGLFFIIIISWVLSRMYSNFI